MSEETKKLNAAQYWEWRCTMEEVKSAQLNEKRVLQDRELMNKDIEIRKLRLALHKTVQQSAHSAVDAAKKEYDRLKKQIEEELNISLDNCVIDEYTYEVKKLEETNTENV